MLNSINADGIFYDIDTHGGQSGAPVYVLGDSRLLVGIHKGFWAKKRLNFATMITTSVIDTLKWWAE
jgi:V8-like Glu-specific endopeptidase